MDDIRRAYAWLMYALAGASQNKPANFAAISQVADCINHAAPTHKEIQSSLKWLTVYGLVHKQSTGYLLTEQGSTVMAKASAGHNTISAVWASLTKVLSAYPA